MSKLCKKRDWEIDKIAVGDFVLKLFEGVLGKLFPEKVSPRSYINAVAQET